MGWHSAQKFLPKSLSREPRIHFMYPCGHHHHSIWATSPSLINVFLQLTFVKWGKASFLSGQQWGWDHVNLGQEIIIVWLIYSKWQFLRVEFILWEELPSTCPHLIPDWLLQRLTGCHRAGNWTGLSALTIGSCSFPKLNKLSFNCWGVQVLQTCICINGS